jgi:SAM-dependent methyltransferase
MAFISELHRVVKPGGRIKLLTPHYTNPDWANDPTHRNHINSYTFNTFIAGREVFDFYTDVQLKPIRTHVSLLGLWKALGIQFLVNLDQRNYAFRFTRKFWEQYLSYVIRGKELQFEFEVVKPANETATPTHLLS